MTTDTSEKGLETIIVRHMTGTDGFAISSDSVADKPDTNGSGYFAGSPKDFDRAHAIDVPQLFAFLKATQPDTFKKLAITDDAKDFNRLRFLARLSAEIGKRGVIDVLRKGVKDGPLEFALFFGTPSPGNATAEKRHAQNRFSITRQFAYSMDEARRALDLGLFINGLPIATFELKNSLTKQTVEDAVEQYRRDRNPRERLFEFGRCVVHFAVDDSEVRMCPELKGKASWFLPFNKGFQDGAGNPPNPTGLKTDYLWKEVLNPAALTNILENYAQIVEEKDPKTGRKKRRQVWPRYHQLDLVRHALEDVRSHGAGKRYLIQHSAGSGKSNSIAWLSHQLIGLKRNEKDVFDSVIVVTDRRILDDQIQKTIKQFMQVGATVGHAEKSGDLRKFIEDGKKIIVSTVQKFPFILDELATEAGKTFAIVIDEAHSSQGGKTSAAMSQALAHDDDDGTDPEDTVNEALEKRMAARKMLKNASYFAFTATPKNETLEMFGIPLPPDAEGKIKHRPFHSYTMKQAIEERFILDVLKAYTPVNSYYKLIKKTDDDPEFDTKKSQKKLRKYVESHDHAIRLKAEIMVDYFHEQVIAAGKIGGQARAMVVCSGIERAIQYFHAFKTYLAERKSPYQAIVAFSGEYEYGGSKVSEGTLNGFSSRDIADKIQEDPYRFLICADKFQTGYDEPLLHTMYVDKPLSGIKAVQTLSRLNRAHPQKYDCFVLDFQNNSEAITFAFQDYYRTTLLAEETDPNKLHDLKGALDNAHVYTPNEVQQVVALFLGGAERDKLDPILDTCVSVYVEALDEDAQVDFKSKAKVFCRTYSFLSSVIPYSNVEWEKLSIFLNLLTPKLPAPKEEDLAKGILDAIDMDSYRVEKKAVMKIALADSDAEIEPVPTEAGGQKSQPELDHLSNILRAFNDQFGTLFTDTDRVAKRIREDIAPKVAADTAYQNAKDNTPHTARMAHDQALGKVMQHLLKDDTQVYKQYVENESFRRFIGDMVYQLTSESSLQGSDTRALRWEDDPPCLRPFGPPPPTSAGRSTLPATPHRQEQNSSLYVFCQNRSQRFSCYQEEDMKQTRSFVGMDVHKATISISVAEDGRAGPVRFLGVIPNTADEVAKMAKRLSKHGELDFCYEASCCGYVLHRQLIGLGHRCIVVAPSLIPRKAGERIKTDRRDSEKLAILHRSGDLTPVWVPDTTHEALRDLVRARVDASMHLMRARQQLLAFLLRHGRSYSTGKHWTQRHRSWLAGQTFQEHAHTIVFHDYLETVWTAQQRRDALIEKISVMVASWSLGPLVEALRGLRGIDTISAATFIASTGDLSRFESPRLLMGYLGLVPSEHSSGGSIRRGGITKTGNREARRMLIEAAWSYQYPARIAKEKAEILVRLPKNVRDIAWKAQTRLCTRYRSMTARGKKPTVVVTAIARELAGFIWAIGQEIRITMATG